MPPTQLLPISTIHEDPTTDTIAPAARQTTFLEEYMHLSLLVLQAVEESTAASCHSGKCCLPWNNSQPTLWNIKHYETQHNFAYSVPVRHLEIILRKPSISCKGFYLNSAFLKFQELSFARLNVLQIHKRAKS